MSLHVEDVVEQHNLQDNWHLKSKSSKVNQMELLDTKQMYCLKTEKNLKFFNSSSRQIFSLGPFCLSKTQTNYYNLFNFRKQFLVIASIVIQHKIKLQ